MKESSFVYFSLTISINSCSGCEGSFKSPASGSMLLLLGEGGGGVSKNSKPVSDTALNVTRTHLNTSLVLFSYPFFP